MSKTTGDNIQTLFQHVEHLESLLSRERDHSKAVQIISEMRSVHGKAICLQNQLLPKSGSPDQDTLIKISTNESTLHLIHCVIRKCEKKVFGNKTSDITTEAPTSNNDANNDNILFDTNSQTPSDIKKGSKSYAVLRMNPGQKCYDISLHGLTQTESPSVPHQEMSVSDLMRRVGTRSPRLNIVSPRLNMTSESMNTSEYLNNIGTTEARELLGASETKSEMKSEQQGGIPPNLDVNKPTVINFWADWCGYSNRFLPAWESFKEYAKTHYPKLQVLDLNVQKDTELRSIASSAGVSGFPTVVFFCDGKIDYMVAGNKNKEDLCKFVEEKGKNNI